MSSSTGRPRFHLAVPVRDLDHTPHFYERHFGATRGRTDARWVDLDLFDHQVTLHLVEPSDAAAEPTNRVDAEDVPVRHFGVILPWSAWHALRDRLVQDQVAFLIEPQIRFAGEIGEQATFFLRDPSGNAIEMKSFRDADNVFRASVPTPPGA